uniref:NADH-ubiquinone oxidoreductase chain 2 n=1 Tax=Pyura gangelion TaxID=569434 RepID=S0DGU5_PYUGA|nr:NADH dehydrogenase subunit 2 [Pyura gangelion]CCO25758.1 NADH dehydrogenase subunit 2 [Pyura gangelion]
MLFFMVLVFVLVLNFLNNFFVWAVLELISVVVLLINLFQNEDNKGVFSLINYFLVQAVAGVLVLGGVLFEVGFGQNYYFFSCPVLVISFYLLLVGLVLKLGLFPFYLQVPYIFGGLVGGQCFVLSVYPKLIPYLLIGVLVPELDINILMGIAGVLVLVGGYQGIWVSSFQELFGWSTIGHSGWLFLSFLMGYYLFFFYFLVYAVTMYYLWVSFLGGMISFFLGGVLGLGGQKMLSVFYFLLVGGLAPMGGFLLKLMVVKGMMGSMGVVYSFFLLILGTGSVIFYVRMMQFLYNVNHNFLSLRNLGKKQILLVKGDFYLMGFVVFLMMGLLFS